MINEMVTASKKYPTLHFSGDRRTAKFYQALLRKHKFWDNQPTLRDDKDQTDHGSVDPIKTVEEVRK